MGKTFNQNLIGERISKTQKMATKLVKLPFVQCVVLNGSLVSGDHHYSSDIDVLIIAKDGHIFTSRFLVNLTAILSGIKRSRDERRDHSGKFCFNFFLTESYLKVNPSPGRELYCAKNYTQSLLVTGDKKTFRKLLLTNQENWQSILGKYEVFATDLVDRIYVEIPEKNLKNKKLIENILSLKIFRFIEKYLKKIQIKKIERTLDKNLLGKNIVYTDREMRFHPPKNKGLMEY